MPDIYVMNDTYSMMIVMGLLIVATFWGVVWGIGKVVTWLKR